MGASSSSGQSSLGANAGVPPGILLVSGSNDSRESYFYFILFYFILFYFIDLNVVLTSAARQRDSVAHVCTFFFVFFSAMVCPRILKTDPCAIQ